ncbi:MAG TPA: Xaa-Pro peptidase family protein [Gaiellaceae bacterium]|nr:Xaa-Pro peptidase family protein [Gaiellaceae bacterium]
MTARSRVQRLAALLEDPLLVAGLPSLEGAQANVRYLTGLASSNAAVVVEPDGRATLYTDFRYLARARALPGVEAVEAPRTLVPALAAALAGRRIGFEEHNLPYAAYRTLVEAGVDAVPTSGLVESLRAVKDAAEEAAIRRAAALSDEVFAALAEERFSGRTERELAWWVERRFREGGAERVAFDVVVAAGETAATPHALPGERTIGRGELVVVDAGGVVDGYCSDCTRTFAVGAVSTRLRDLHALCLRAQLAGLEAVGPGVPGRDADAASRAPVEEAGLGAAYGHGLGHGVGLQVHEAPVLRPESTDVLEPGNVVTVEPGIYLEGEAGVRIEDLVLVTAEGAERLTRVTKELVDVA